MTEILVESSFISCMIPFLGVGIGLSRGLQCLEFAAKPALEFYYVRSEAWVCKLLHRHRENAGVNLRYIL